METETESVNENATEARLSKRMNLRRKQVCDVAARLFATNGYQATTLEMIAEELGYSKPNLYHYFKNKESIILQLIENLTVELFTDAERIIEESDAPADEVLRDLITSGVEILCSHPESRVLWAYEASLHTESRIDIVTMGSEYPAGVQRYFALVKTVYDKGKDSGLFRKVEDVVVIFLILGAVSQIPRGYDPKGPLSPRQIGEQLSDIIMSGLRAPSS